MKKLTRKTGRTISIKSHPRISSPFLPSSTWQNIPNKDQYTLLAQLKEIAYESDKTLTGLFKKNKKKRIVKFETERWELLWNPIEKCLLGIRKKLLKKVEMRKEDFVNSFHSNPSYQMVRIFKDYDFSSAYYADLQTPIDFKKVGKAIHVVYKSNKWNPKTYYEYIHEFGEDGRVVEKNHGVVIYYDRLNKLIKMCGGKLTVNERGIIN